MKPQVLGAERQQLFLLSSKRSRTMGLFLCSSASSLPLQLYPYLTSCLPPSFAPSLPPQFFSTSLSNSNPLFFALSFLPSLPPSLACPCPHLTSVLHLLKPSLHLCPHSLTIFLQSSLNASLDFTITTYFVYSLNHTGSFLWLFSFLSGSLSCSLPYLFTCSLVRFPAPSFLNSLVPFLLPFLPPLLPSYPP